MSPKQCSEIASSLLSSRSHSHYVFSGFVIGAAFKNLFVCNQLLPVMFLCYTECSSISLPSSYQPRDAQRKVLAQTKTGVCVKDGEKNLSSWLDGFSFSNFLPEVKIKNDFFCCGHLHRVLLILILSAKLCAKDSPFPNQDRRLYQD